MPKTLTKLQEQIVAKVLTITATQFVWCREGEVNSINNLRGRGLVKDNCYGSVQHHHLTDEIKNAFFGENDETFNIPNFHGEGWLIFHDRRYICKVYKEDDAKLVVQALKDHRDLQEDLKGIEAQERQLGIRKTAREMA